MIAKTDVRKILMHWLILILSSCVRMIEYSSIEVNEPEFGPSYFNRGSDLWPVLSP